MIETRFEKVSATFSPRIWVQQRRDIFILRSFDIFLYENCFCYLHIRAQMPFQNYIIFSKIYGNKIRHPVTISNSKFLEIIFACLIMFKFSWKGKIREVIGNFNLYRRKL